PSGGIPPPFASRSYNRNSIRLVRHNPLISWVQAARPFRRIYVLLETPRRGREKDIRPKRDKCQQVQHTLRKIPDQTALRLRHIVGSSVTPLRCASLGSSAPSRMSDRHLGSAGSFGW